MYNPSRILEQASSLFEQCLSLNNLCVLQKTIYGANVVIFEGIMSFVNKDLLKVCVC